MAADSTNRSNEHVRHNEEGDNTISPELTMSLRANGYGPLLKNERARSA
jgi:hypothetical protein